jgi:hypothetical protein
MAKRISREEASVEVISSLPQRNTKKARLNLIVPLSLDVRLSAQAKLQKRGKSHFAEYLLDQALSKYKTDKALKSFFEQSLSEEGEAA